MTGMFYSLQEAAERLNKTEEEVREIVRAGKLREFRDGPNLLFKVDEVEGLIVDEDVPIQIEGLEQEIPAMEAPAPQAPTTEPDAVPLELESLEPEAPQAEIPLEAWQAPAAEAADLEIFEPEVPQAGIGSGELEAPAPEPAIPQAEIPQAEIPQIPATQGPELEIPGLEVPGLDAPEALLAEPSDFEIPEMEAPEVQVPPGSEIPAGTSEILLAPETGAPVPPSELTNADTAITGEGVSVLGETDRDYAITDDTLSETIGTLGATGTTPEAALEEIEGDVNLDSFGSGSGLLDLSLQADDTSLGGILDEIYTAEDEAAEPAEAGTVEEVVAEADQIAEDDLVAPQADLAMPAQARLEAAPDKAGNILGLLLWLPIALVAYTIIVALCGNAGLAPPILTKVQGVVFWYIMGGCLVLALVVSGLAFMSDREAAPAATKPKKAKKTKKPKKPKKGKEFQPPTPEDSVA